MKFFDIYEFVDGVKAKVAPNHSEDNKFEVELLWIYTNICTDIGAEKDNIFCAAEDDDGYGRLLRTWNSAYQVVSNDPRRSASNIHFLLVALYVRYLCGNTFDDTDEDVLFEYASEVANDTDEEICSILGEELGLANYTAKAEPKPQEETEPEQEETPPVEEETQEQTEPDEEDTGGLDPELLAELKSEYVYPNVTAILKVYAETIAPCFEKPTRGVLCDNGVWTYDAKKHTLVKVLTQSDTIKKIYQLFVAKSENKLKMSTERVINFSMLDESGRLKFNYVPKFIAQICYGLKANKDGTFTRVAKWEDYQKDLKVLITDMLSEVIKQVALMHKDGNTSCAYSTVINSIRDLFTNCIIFMTYEKRTEMRMVYKLDNLVAPKIIGSVFETSERELFGLSKGMGKLISDECKEGVSRILYVFNEKLYTGDVLFAYRAFEDKINAGGKISEYNVLLGQYVNGDDAVLNMGTPQAVSTMLVAGSGSGKGVLTLNILATLVASGCPIAYLDFKPDMAAALWDMERKLGCKILAIDGLDNSTDRGQVPVREFEQGAGAEGFDIGLETKHYAIIPYLKLMQLSAVLASNRQSGVMKKGKKVFFILDEAQGCNAEYAEMMGILKGYVNNSKNAKADDDNFKYAKKLFTAFGASFGREMGKTITTTGRAGVVGYFVIGQNSDPAAWKDGISPDWKYSTFGCFTGRSYRKILGKNSGPSKQYGLAGLKDAGGLGYIRGQNGEDGKLGYFTLATASNDADSEGRAFKSYLVLNDNDYEKNPENGYAGSLLVNIQDDELREKIITQDFYNDGVLNPRVGLIGLMNYIAEKRGVDIKASLGGGYALIEEVMTLCGLMDKYSCVEEYLFDCSMDSIFTYSELKDMTKQRKNATSTGAKGKTTTGGFGSYSQDMTAENPVTEEQPQGTTEGTTETQGSEPMSSGYDEYAKNDTETTNEETPEEAWDDPDNATAYDEWGTEDTESTESTESAEDEQDTPQPIPTPAPTPTPAPAPTPTPTPTPTPQPEPTYYEPLPTEAPPINDEVSKSWAKPEPVSKPINKRNNYTDDNCYSRPLDVKENPYVAMGEEPTPMDMMSALAQMSDALERAIKATVGDLRRVKRFRITADENIYVNGIAIRPTVSDNFIDELPFDVKDRVRRGCYADMLRMDIIYKFKGLQEFRIDDTNYAETRVKYELGLTDRKNKSGWLKLYDKIPSLQVINIGGTIIKDDEEEYKKSDSYQSFSLMEKLRKHFKMPSISRSGVAKVYSSPKIPKAVKAAGVIAGIGGMLWLANTLGLLALPAGIFLGTRIKD